jgi:bifunctional DNA-binding transcriptional regulator/antitoxin component of YhaV-PrlF toxin-antitoxin module
MKSDTTLTSKYQFTLPKPVRAALGVKVGTKFAIYPTAEGFESALHRKSRILDVAGDLPALDDGNSIEEIRGEAQTRAARALVSRLK